jgi:hypothetical protein
VGKHRLVVFNERVTTSDQMWKSPTASVHHAMRKEAAIAREQSNVAGR